MLISEYILIKWNYKQEEWFIIGSIYASLVIVRKSWPMVQIISYFGITDNVCYKCQFVSKMVVTMSKETPFPLFCFLEQESQEYVWCMYDDF